MSSGQLPTRFGPYEIIGPLGAGGMGAVYRARDTRLQREVAIKILPEAAAASPDRQRRFTQEAVAASALNHPNILSVYDVGVENGTPYLVSELIDGVSLRHEMDRGRLPLRRILDIAVQIADGLTAAHEAGIVHRDLKPDNVMITRGSRVKILDFGLAKTSESSDVTVPSALTQTAEGLIVGTVPYMSPEQARGDKIDFRSDQFAFGLVLYEMVTGVHPFRRATPVQTLSAIIGDEAAIPAEMAATLPVPLRWTIERCLSKDAGGRYGVTLDLAHDLRLLRERLSELTAAERPRRGRTRVRRAAPYLAAVAAVASLAAAIAVVTGASGGTGRSLYRFVPVATDPGFQGMPAFSPDGKTIAYAADIDGVVQIFTRSLGGTQRYQVTKSAFDCRDPFWSPDGTRIYYISQAGEKDGLFSISAAGGERRPEMENVDAAALSPDGQTLAFSREEGSVGSVAKKLWISSPPGAEPRPYKTPPFGDRLFAHAVLHFSPDGSKLGVWTEVSATVAAGGAARVLWLIPLPTGNPITTLASTSKQWTGIAHFGWLPDNRHVVIAEVDARTPGSHLWLADTTTDAAEPVMLTTGNENYPTVSPAGDAIAYDVEASDFDLIEVSDGSPPRVLRATSRNEMDPAWAPNALQYVYVTDRAGAEQIWLRSADGQFDLPLVTEKDFGEGWVRLFYAPTFSPDGQRIAYSRFGPDGNKIWISPLAGGRPMRLSNRKPSEESPTWSPDGEWIAYFMSDESRGRWSLVKTRFGGSGTAILKDDVLVSSRPRWAPNGQWIACETAEGVVLVSPDGRGSRALGSAGWLAFDWEADSSRLVGLKVSDEQRLALVTLDVQTTTEKIITPDLGPVPLANQPVRGFSRISARSFATSLVRVRSDIWLLEGFRRPSTWLERFTWRR